MHAEAGNGKPVKREPRSHIRSLVDCLRDSARTYAGVGNRGQRDGGQGRTCGLTSDRELRKPCERT